MIAYLLTVIIALIISNLINLIPTRNGFTKCHRNGIRLLIVWLVIFSPVILEYQTYIIFDRQRVLEPGEKFIIHDDGAKTFTWVVPEKCNVIAVPTKDLDSDRLSSVSVNVGIKGENKFVTINFKTKVVIDDYESAISFWRRRYMPMKSREYAFYSEWLRDLGDQVGLMSSKGIFSGMTESDVARTLPNAIREWFNKRHNRYGFFMLEDPRVYATSAGISINKLEISIPVLEMNSIVQE